MSEDKTHTLSIHDALVFEQPSWRAWDVVVGVADGLRAQLDDAAFGEAMGELDDALTSWPTTFRRLPLHWLSLLHLPEADPRLRLVRALDLGRMAIAHAAKDKARVISWVASSPHLGHVTSLKLLSHHQQKSLLQAYGTMFEALEPERVFIGSHNGEKRQVVVDALAEYGLEPAEPERLYVPAPHVEEELASRLERQPLLNVRLTSMHELETLLGTDGLDHVVELSLSVGRILDPSGQHTELLGDLLERAATPAWGKLRWLEVAIDGSENDLEGYALLARAVSRWLSRARPVVTVPALNPTPADEVFVLDAVRAGLYERAYGGQLDVFLDWSEGQVLEVLGADNVRVKFVCFMGRSTTREIARAVHEGSSWPVIAGAHPTLKASLKVLQAPLSVGDLEHVEDIMVALPELAVWCPQTTMIPEHRDALIEALMAAPSASSIGVFVPELRGGESKQDLLKPLNAKESTRMAGGDGLRPEAFVARSVRVYAPVILSNYL